GVEVNDVQLLGSPDQQRERGAAAGADAEGRFRRLAEGKCRNFDRGILADLAEDNLRRSPGPLSEPARRPEFRDLGWQARVAGRHGFRSTRCRVKEPGPWTPSTMMQSKNG